MNREDVIRMAKDAGMDELQGQRDTGECCEYYEGWTEQLERFAALVAAATREECAKVCDAEATIEGIAQKCAAAIRALK